MSRSERIAQQLGMSQGSAQNRLRKSILFSFAKRLKEDVCFKCSKTIETVEELSIEHKQPWEGRSAELFWSLENIAFSHMSCNKPHEYSGGGHNRKDSPVGTAWCSVCQKFEPVEMFAKNVNHWNGLQRHCKEQRPDR